MAHSCTVIGATQVLGRHGDVAVRLVKVRSPWVSWKGRFSYDDVDAWTLEVQRLLGVHALRERRMLDKRVTQMVRAPVTIITAGAPSLPCSSHGLLIRPGSRSGCSCRLTRSSRGSRLRSFAGTLWS